jgi:glycogen operon protein
MICHGDELGRTQGGNNNGYCQDNEITWVDWENADTDLLEFTQTVSALRAAHPVFRRRRFFSGKPVGRRGEAGLPDIAWFTPDGAEMTGEDWGSGFAKSVGVFLNGHGIPDRDTRNQPIIDDSFVLFFNAHHEDIEFTLPPEEFGTAWQPVIDTRTDDPDREAVLKAGLKIPVEARTVIVLQAVDVDG